MRRRATFDPRAANSAAAGGQPSPGQRTARPAGEQLGPGRGMSGAELTLSPGNPPAPPATGPVPHPPHLGDWAT